MARYDAIIVGAGISGLTVGALLTNAGKKILILEGAPHIGGRGFSTTHNGEIVDNGIHGFANLGFIEEVFSRLGIPFPETTTWKTSELWHEGKWRNFQEMINRQEVKRIIVEEILPMSYEDIEKLDDVPLDEWVSQMTDDEGADLFFWNIGYIAAVGGESYGSISAGETLFYLKDQVTKHGGMKNSALLFPEGQTSLLKPLSDVIQEKGGEIRANTRVSHIVVKEGKACGVEVETGERIIPVQILDTEFIEAPVVISTLPLWDMFSIISPDELPHWYVQWVRELSEKVTYLWGIRYSLDKPLFDDYKLNIWKKSPTNQKINIGGMVSIPPHGRETGRYVYDAWQQAAWEDVPSHIKSGGRIVTHEVRKYLAAFEKDLNTLFPELESLVRHKHYYGNIYGIAEATGTVGRYRPGIQPPGIKGLYLASETLRDSRVTGMEAAVRCSLVCADAILR